MRKSAITALVATTAAVALMLAGCSSGGSGGSGGTSKTGIKVGVIMLQGDTYFQGIQSGLEAAAKKDGGSVVTGLSNNDPATENQVAQNMIQAGVKAILMQPAADAASVATMKTIRAAKITLICYGNCIGDTTDPTLVQGVIQSDNTALGTGTGVAAAKYIKDKLNGSVNLGILNCDIASACKLRKTGFLKALSDAGVKVNVVTDQEGYLTDKATTVATGELTANASINMLWASNDGGTEGATIAVKQAGKKIPVFGTDIATQIAGFLLSSDDILQASTGQDPIGTATGAYEMAKKAVAGQKNTPFSVQLPGVVYDRANPATTKAFVAANSN
jgi:ABC-type sugar transport system substrate-binding protein